MPTRTNRTRVVAIVALDHSGSHLLSQLLGAHSRCLSVGELHNYVKLTSRSRGGNVTADYGEAEIFAGLRDAPVERWHELVFCNAQGRYPTITTIIDNSKRVEWCASLLRNPRLEVTPLHLLRDPRAMLRYWQRSYDSPRKIRRQRIRHARMAPLQAPQLLTCPLLELYLRKWLIRNEAASRLLRRSGHPTNVVTYHDLATCTARTLERIMPMLGLEYEPAQLRYGEATQHGTLKTEYRAASERSEIRLDVRWQNDLDADQIHRVEADTRLAGYFHRLGLSLTPLGLTAFGS